MYRRKLWPALISLVAISALAQTSPPNDHSLWWIAQSVEDGNEVIYRVLAGVPDKAIVARYPSLATIDWVYAPAKDGMPVREVAEQMYEFEDLVESRLENNSMGVLAFTRTGNGKRQWSYYVANRSAFENALEMEVKKAHAFPVQVRFANDPSWDALMKMHYAAGK